MVLRGWNVEPVPNLQITKFTKQVGKAQAKFTVTHAERVAAGKDGLAALLQAKADYAIDFIRRYGA